MAGKAPKISIIVDVDTTLGKRALQKFTARIQEMSGKGPLSILGAKNVQRGALSQIKSLENLNNKITRTRQLFDNAKMSIAKLSDPRFQEGLRGLGFSTEDINKNIGKVQRTIDKLAPSLAKLEKAIPARKLSMMGRVMNKIGLGNLHARLSKTAKGMKQVGDETRKASFKMSHMIARSITLVGVLGLVFGAVNAFKLGLKTAFGAIEDYKKGIAGMTALTLTFMKVKPGEGLEAQYRRANIFATALFHTLEEVAATTLLTGDQVNLMANIMLRNGVAIDTNNKKQIESFKAIGNAILIATAGQDQERQIQSELSNIMSGRITAQDRLGKMLLSINPSLRADLKVWKEQGTVLENLAGLLKGFEATTKDLGSTWQVVSSLLETTYKQIMRKGLQIAFEDIVQLAKDLNKHMDENRATIQLTVKKGYLKLKEIITTVVGLVVKWRKELRLVLLAWFGSKGLIKAISLFKNLMLAVITLTKTWQRTLLFGIPAAIVGIGFALNDMFKDDKAIKSFGNKIEEALGKPIDNAREIMSQFPNLVTATIPQLRKMAKAGELGIKSIQKVRSVDPTTGKSTFTTQDKLKVNVSAKKLDISQAFLSDVDILADEFSNKFAKVFGKDFVSDTFLGQISTLIVSEDIVAPFKVLSDIFIKLKEGTQVSGFEMTKLGPRITDVSKAIKTMKDTTVEFISTAGKISDKDFKKILKTITDINNALDKFRKVGEEKEKQFFGIPDLDPASQYYENLNKLDLESERLATLTGKAKVDAAKKVIDASQKLQNEVKNEGQVVIGFQQAYLDNQDRILLATSVLETARDEEIETLKKHSSEIQDAILGMKDWEEVANRFMKDFNFDLTSISSQLGMFNGELKSTLSMLSQASGLSIGFASGTMGGITAVPSAPTVLTGFSSGINNTPTSGQLKKGEASGQSGGTSVTIDASGMVIQTQVDNGEDLSKEFIRNVKTGIEEDGGFLFLNP